MQPTRNSQRTGEHFMSWDIPASNALHKPHVVVLGSGFAGASAAMILQDHARVTLVDKKNYFENTCAMHRVTTNPEILANNRLLPQEFAPHIKFLQGEAKLTSDGLFVGKEPVAYDYLIIATGASYKTNMSSERSAYCNEGSALQKAHKYLQDASKVAVVGGGAAGIEIASEICEEYPNKQIYLFHSGSTLLPRLPNSAQQTALHHLSQYNNIHIKFGERISHVGPNGNVTTSSGHKFDTSIAYICTGLKPNSEFFTATNNAINLDGTFKVNQHLQVDGLEKVFAIGDVAGTGEEFLAGNAFKHAKIAATNIQLLEQGKPLEIYNPEQRQMGIMLGRYNAMIVKNGSVTTGLSIALRKQAIGLTARVLPVFNAFMARP